MSPQKRTNAIVLHRLRYNDSYDIACLYTYTQGRISYLVPAHKERRGKSKQSARAMLARIVSPPSELEIIADHRDDRSLHFLREASLVNPYMGIRLDPTKSSIILFLCELLYRVLSEPEQDEKMYRFISQSFQFLEHSPYPTANFHLSFMWQLATLMGIIPSTLAPPRQMQGNSLWYDLGENRYMTESTGTNCMSPKATSFLSTFGRITYENMHHYLFSRQERQEILSLLLTYYRCHLPRFGELRSLDILSSLYD